MSLHRFNPSLSIQNNEASPRFTPKNADNKQPSPKTELKLNVAASSGNLMYNAPTFLQRLRNNRIYIQLSRTRLLGGGKVKILIQLLLFFWLLNSLVEKFQFTDNDDSRFQHLRNTYCKPNSPEEICQMPNQYKKFIWVFVDSLAYDQAQPLLTPFTSNYNLHKVMHYGFKFSTAIYTSFFTGKVPTNYAGKEILSDNLFYQMRNAGMRMKFVGPKFPTLTLLGKGAFQYFEEIVQVNTEERVLDFLQENINKPFLADAARRGQSLFFTTNLFDERIHKSGKKDPNNQALLPPVKPIFQKLKQFVDKN